MALLEEIIDLDCLSSCAVRASACIRLYSCHLDIESDGYSYRIRP